MVSLLMLLVGLARAVKWSNSSPVQSEQQVLLSVDKKISKGKSTTEWLEFKFVDDERTYKLMSQDYGSADISGLLRDVTSGSWVEFSFQTQLGDNRIKHLKFGDRVYTDFEVAGQKEIENFIWILVPSFFLLAACIIPAFSKSEPQQNFFNLASTGLVVTIVILTLTIGCDSLYQK